MLEFIGARGGFRAYTRGMTNPLQLLYRVQELDLSLDRLKNEEANIPEELSLARAQQETLSREAEDISLELSQVEKDIRQTELDLASLAEQITKATAEQEKADTKAQIQYSHRLQMLQERAEEQQEDLLPLQEKQASLLQQQEVVSNKKAAHQPIFESLEAADELRIAALRAEAEEAAKEREEVSAKIEPRVLKEYNMIRKSKKGVGVTLVDAGGRCEACHVVLPINVQQRVAQGKWPPVKCPSCGRFLISVSIIKPDAA